MYDTTIGWRFVNKLMKEQYGVDSMPETAENVATDYKIEREAQDRMALASQQTRRGGAEVRLLRRRDRAGDGGAEEGRCRSSSRKDEHPRDTSLEALAKLKGVVRPDGTVTAGNASGVNDGAAALLLADEARAAKYGLTPRARVVGMATAGVPPRIMGIGPAPATQKVLALTGLKLDQIDVIELNEAFAAQGLAVLRLLGPEGRRCARQHQRRRDRAGPSAGRQRCAPGHHRRQPAAQGRRPLRAVHDVHRRGAGHRGHPRARLIF